MKISLIKKIIFAVIIVVAFFSSIELVSRLFLFPGSYDYIERCVMDQGLRQRKAAGEYRIFLFGESTMHGHYLYPRSTIGVWIRLYLGDLLPEDAARRVTVTNFGRMGGGSDFATDAFIETIPYKPDLAVFYMAHNDYILTEYRKIYFRSVPLKERMENFLEEIPKKSSFLTFINRWYISERGKLRALEDSRNKREDSWYTESDRQPFHGEEDMPLYPGSAESAAIKDRFEANVKSAIRSAERRSIKAVFLEGVSKWRGYEPVKSMHGRSLTKDALKKWDDLDPAAEALFKNNKFRDAIPLYEGCLKIDDAYALTYYRIGQCYEYMNDPVRANEYYSLANDKDCFPIRGPSAVNRFYEDIRKDGLKGVYVIQTRDIFEKNAPGGIIGDDLVADQIHPTIKGQAMIALEIVRLMYENSFIVPKEAWRWDKLKSAEEMVDRLNIDREFKFNMNLAMAGYVERHYSKAAEFLEKAARIKPDSVFVNSWLAWAYWKLGEEARAIGLYEKLYQKAPAAAGEFFKAHPEIGEKVIEKKDKESERI